MCDWCDLNVFSYRCVRRSLSTRKLKGKKSCKRKDAIRMRKLEGNEQFFSSFAAYEYQLNMIRFDSFRLINTIANSYSPANFPQISLAPTNSFPTIFCSTTKSTKKFYFNCTFTASVENEKIKWNKNRTWAPLLNEPHSKRQPIVPQTGSHIHRRMCASCIWQLIAIQQLSVWFERRNTKKRGIYLKRSLFVALLLLSRTVIASTHTFRAGDIRRFGYLFCVCRRPTNGSKHNKSFHLRAIQRVKSAQLNATKNWSQKTHSLTTNFVLSIETKTRGRKPESNWIACIWFFFK